MPLISQKTFDNFTEEEKKKLRDDYNSNPNDRHILERTFGKENLQPKSKIRTWKDVEKKHPEYFKSHNTPNPMLIPSEELRDKLLNKSIAMYKIATIIELGYGGIISNKEWDDAVDNSGFYIIFWNPLYKSFHTKYVTTHKCFISFRTEELAEEFMHYPENVELLRQFNML